MPALNGIVVAQWSQDGQLLTEHINKQHHNVFTHDSLDTLLLDIITTLSYDGQTLIDATESGKFEGISALCTP